MRRWLTRLAFTATPLFVTVSARGQALTAPELVENVEPEYPESKKATAESAAVDLTLTVGVDGTVTDVAVTTSAGPAFDEAAVAAARRLRFKPALRDETPIVARIPFHVDLAYEPPPPPPPEPAAPPPAPPAAPTVVQELRVKGPPPAREPTRRVLEQRELVKAPGTGGDALRAVENMPGVARPPGGVTGLLVVRGSAPQDTTVFVDKVDIPLIYHFGGLRTVIPSEMLETIDFVPGNYGPQYGRAMGGVIDVGIRSPRSDGFHAVGQVDVLDARVLVEGPLGKRTRFFAGARRSWVDAWITPILEGGATGVTTAPVYYDYQALIEHDITDSVKARLFFHGSDDRLKLLLNDVDEDPAISGALSVGTNYYRLTGSLDARLGKDTRWLTTIAYGTNHTKFSVGNALSIDQKFNPLTVRSDVQSRLTRWLGIAGGIDSLWSPGTANVLAGPPPTDTQNEGPGFARPRARREVDATLFRPAAYAMLDIAPVTGLKLLPSIRADYSSDIREWVVSPRFAARYDVVTEYPRTTLKGAIGRYYQPPQPNESFPPFGTRNLSHNRALHTSFGVEQDLLPKVSLSVEGFYKKLDNLVIQNQNAGASSAFVDYVNTGEGRVLGGELLLRYRPDDRFFGWLAYTLSKSERRDTAADAYRTFDYDQTHILTALGSYRLGSGWEVGARFRYVTGNPYTPPTSAVFDADAGAYQPINGTPYSGRSGAFHQLDVRVEKTWTFSAWKLSTYLDLQNVYVRRNPEGRTYNFNYTRSDVVSGLPILPVIGIRGEL